MRLTESQLRSIVRKLIKEQEDTTQNRGAAPTVGGSSDVKNSSTLKQYFIALSKDKRISSMPANQTSRIASIIDELIDGGAAGEFSQSEVELIDKGLAKVAKSTAD